jgi:hypothetical protein
VINLFDAQFVFAPSLGLAGTPALEHPALPHSAAESASRQLVITPAVSYVGLPSGRVEPMALDRVEAAAVSVFATLGDGPGMTPMSAALPVPTGGISWQGAPTAASGLLLADARPAGRARDSIFGEWSPFDADARQLSGVLNDPLGTAIDPALLFPDDEGEPGA